MRQLLMIIFTISTIYADTIRWQGNYDEALQQAKEDKKVLMVLLIKSDCQECKNIIRDIFMDKPYIEELDKNIVAVIVNIDNKHSFPIEMYWSGEYPTLFFINSLNEIFIHKPFYNVTQKDIEDILMEIKSKNSKMNG